MLAPMFHPGARLRREQLLAEEVAAALTEHGKITWRADGSLVFRVADGREIALDRRSGSPFGRYVTSVLGISTMADPIRRAVHVLVSKAEDYRNAAIAADAQKG